MTQDRMLLFVRVWVIASADEIVKRYVKVVRKDDEYVDGWCYFSVFIGLINSFIYACYSCGLLLSLFVCFAKTA